jgi:hypothetical protein
MQAGFYLDLQSALWLLLKLCKMGFAPFGWDKKSPGLDYQAWAENL